MKKKESEIDHYATYQVERRDLEREAEMQPEKRALLRAWIVARARLVRAAGEHRTISTGGGSSVMLTPPNFGRIYDALENASNDELAEWYADVTEMQDLLGGVRDRAKADRAEQQYERQALRVDAYEKHGKRDRRLRGKRVWLYHGTSSALLKKISREGLRPDMRPIEVMGTTPGYVYLTAEPGSWSWGGSAWFYARRAASKFGGEPVLLRVIVEFDDLEPDDDDSDLQNYHAQFRTRRTVPPGAIMEADGQRLRERYGS